MIIRVDEIVSKIRMLRHFLLLSTSSPVNINEPDITIEQKFLYRSFGV